MKISRFCAGLCVLATALLCVAVSGCGGGWGDLKPTIAGTTSSSNGASGTGSATSQALTVVAGQPATFSVTPQGTGPFTYQWFMNGQAITGATSSSYTIPATSGSQNNAVFTVAISNAAGTVTAGPYNLTVNVPPTVVSTSSSGGNGASGSGSGSGGSSGSGSGGSGSGTGQALTVVAGQPATFSVTPQGTGPFTYQWYLNGQPIAGATAGSYTIPATELGQSNDVFTVAISNVAGTVTAGPYTLTVSPIVPTLTFANVGTETYGNAPFPVTASSASSGAITYAVVSGPATIAGNVVTLDGTGTVVLQATQAANGNYAAATATTSVTVGAEGPTLTFAPIPTKTYGNAPFTVTASSASSGAITYSVVSGPATIAGNVVTLTGAGPVEIMANQAATSDYTAKTATTSFTVGDETPTLTFTPIPTETDGNPAFPVTASSASSGAITYSVVSGPATIAGNMVTLTGAGTVVLQATQAANGNYTSTMGKTSFQAIYSTPVATSLVGSNSTPAYDASINLVPTFTGGTAVIGSSGPGSSDISASAVSGSSYPTPAITGVKTYTLTVTGSGGNTTTTTFTATPSSVSVGPISPANQTFAPGPLPFSATATGGATNQLTWTASSGSISSTGVWTAPDIPGSYTITATSVDNPSIAVHTTATISAAVLLSQPTSRNACSGYPVSLSMAANYASSYQWTEGGSIVGTNATLTFSPAETTNSGTYQCTAINAAGNATCNPVVLNVSAPTTPQITQQPASVSVYATQTATFSVSATGTGGLSYQWYQGTPGSGTLIPGATSSSYTTGALTMANNGATYYATVIDSNCTGTMLTSNAGTLTVSDADTAVPPTIVVQPQAQTASVGGEATFSVTASGSGTLSYQWYRVPYGSSGMASTDGTAIPDATSSTYTVPSNYTNQSDDGDNYYVLVTNGYGTALSNRVTLAVGSGIVMQITGQPQTTYVPATAVASFSVSASCTACTPAYQWYWDAPGTSTPVALTDGAISSGTLNGATVIGSATSSLTLENVPATASGSVLYATVTSTSNGATISGTDPLTSNNAGLFVGSLGTVGNTGVGQGLCNSSGTSWVLNGSENNGVTQHTGGTTSGDVPYQNTSACTLELTNDQGEEQATVYWPTLISTANFTASFTVTISDTTASPADGFTMVLADPSQGATTASSGAVGEGLGAKGIPGLVVGFDTYQNGNANGGTPTGGEDPVTVPYMAVGPGATNLWESPWYFVNGYLNTQNSTDYGEDTGITDDPDDFTNSAHNYVISVVNGVMTVTMDGYELFTGTVNLPPVAYMGFTASTGGSQEAVTFSNMNVTVSAP